MVDPLPDRSSFAPRPNEAPWMAARRAAAIGVFKDLPMPSAEEEIWRYVDLDFDLDDYATAGQPVVPLGGDRILASIRPAGSLRVIDGVAVDPRSEADGYTLDGLAAAAAVDEVVVARALTRVGVAADTDRFAAAHDALGGDGAFVHVRERGAVPGPLYVDLQATQHGAMVLPRVVVVAEEGSSASIVIQQRSSPEDDVLVVPQFNLIVGPNAHLSVSLIQNWGSQTRSIGHATAAIDRDASLRIAEIGIGGTFSRLHLEVDLEGQGSTADVLGAYFGDREQTLDYRYFMRHIGLNTRSDMLLKGAVEDQADSVFTGMIRIEEEAQKTEAFQTNRNLILSEGASAQSVPNLEILANDVRCGHGSTVGPLDEDQRYYLMSRGLERAQSDRLQVRGFFEEVIAKLPEPGLAAPLRSWVNGKYIAAQQEGRA